MTGRLGEIRLPKFVHSGWFWFSAYGAQKQPEVTQSAPILLFVKSSRGVCQKFPGVLFNPNLSLQLVGKEKSIRQRGNTELSDQDGDNVTSNQSINQSVSVIEQMIGQPQLIRRNFLFTIVNTKCQS